MSDVLILPEQLDAVAAGPLLESLRERVGQPLTINASAVNRITTPVFQVLLSAAKSWREAGHAMVFHEPSAAFASAAALLGVSKELPGLETLTT